MPMDVQHLTHACQQQMEMMEMHVQLHVLQNVLMIISHAMVELMLMDVWYLTPVFQNQVRK